MAREEDARAALGLGAEHLAERLDRDRVETRERLVEDEQVGLVHERGRELDALLVAVRQLLDGRVRAVAEAEPIEPRVRGGERGGPVETVELGEEGELGGGRHLRVEAALLRHVAETEPRVPVDRAPVPAHLALVERDEPEHAAHRGRLAGPVRAEEADDPSARNLERGAVERDDRVRTACMPPRPTAQPPV